MNIDNSETIARSESDFRINKYTLRCLRILLYAIFAMWLADIFHLFIVDLELLSKGFSVTVCIMLCTLIFGKFADLHKPWVKYVLIFATILSVTVLGITLTYHTLLLSMIPLLIAAQYTDKHTLRFTYVLTLISTFAIVMGGYFWGLCDANMLFLTTNTTSYYRDLANQSIRFDTINTNPWYTLPVYYVLPRSILLTLALPVINKITLNIRYYEKYALQMKQLSEKDEMTGLYNRNKYLDMAKETYPEIDTVAVIFWDVNHLKQTNDSLGHDIGDALLTNVANIITALSDVHRKAYRLGGDEFVMIIENPHEGETETILKKWEELSILKSKAADIEISAAIGCACGKGKDIEAILKEADQTMYQNKQQQHQDSSSQCTS